MTGESIALLHNMQWDRYEENYKLQRHKGAPILTNVVISITITRLDYVGALQLPQVARRTLDLCLLDKVAPFVKTCD